MGVFDLFGKAKPKNNRLQVYGESEIKNSFDAPVNVFHPQSFGDVAAIIDVLKKGKNAVVHLDKVKTETSVRVIDMLSGAVYALGGGLYEMQENIYMFSPSGVEIK